MYHRDSKNCEATRACQVPCTLITDTVGGNNGKVFKRVVQQGYRVVYARMCSYIIDKFGGFFVKNFLKSLLPV